MLNKHLWAMEGLLPGVHQSMEPEMWKNSRWSMIKDADTDARTLLGQEIDSLRAAAQQEQAAMFVDAQAPNGSQQQYGMEVDAMPAGPSSISAAG